MRRTRAGAMLAATALIALAGCGDDKKDTKTTAAGATAAATPSAPALKGDPIVIGSICSCSGPLARSIGRSLDVVEAWAKNVNATGGVNGHPVKLVTVDDGQNPAKALAGAKKLIEQDKVVAIVGQMSLQTAAWEKYASQKGVPVIGGQSVEAAFLTNPGFFASGSTLPLLMFGELAQVKAAGKKHLGLFYCAETPICAQLEPILKGLGKPLGIEVSAQKVSTTAPNYTAPCLSFKQKGVDSLLIAMISTVVPRVVDACAQQGFRPVSIAGNTTTERSWADDDNLDGSLLAGTNAVYTDESVPGVKEFNEVVRKYLPDLPDSPQFSAPLLMPWAGAKLFQAAAEQAKLAPTSTPADLMKGLYALKDETLDGVAPPLNFVKGKPGFPTCFFSAKLEGGEFKATDGGKPTCLPAAQAAQIAAALQG